MATTETAAESTEVGFVVANIGGAFKRFRELEHVPAGTEQVFTGKEDLADLKLSEISEIYARLTGQAPKKFKDKKTGIENLVYQFAKLEPLTEDEEAATDEPVEEKKAPGRRKYVKKVKGIYRLAEVTKEVAKAISNLAPQAQAIHAVMVDGGKTEYGEDELRKLVEDNKPRLHTKQPSWRIFQYYKGKLIGCDALKDVATKPVATKG